MRMIFAAPICDTLAAVIVTRHQDILMFAVSRSNVAALLTSLGGGEGNKSRNDVG